MTAGHILRVLFAIAVSGTVGWFSLAAIYAVKILQNLEQVEAHLSDQAANKLAWALEAALFSIGSGTAMFAATAIGGVLLGEVFKVRPVLFYAGVTGGLAALFAAVFWQHTAPDGNTHPAAALAMAGFVAGGVYWMIAGYSARQA